MFVVFHTHEITIACTQKRRSLLFRSFFFTFSETISLVILTAALAFFPLIKISLEYIQM